MDLVIDLLAVVLAVAVTIETIELIRRAWRRYVDSIVQGIVDAIRGDMDSIVQGIDSIRVELGSEK
jgi:hypothetical protein